VAVKVQSVRETIRALEAATDAPKLTRLKAIDDGGM